MENQLEIFPNPASDFIEIRNYNKNEIERFELYSIEGECLKDFSNNRLTTKDLKPGVYFILGIAGENSLNGKFIKK